MTSKPKRKAMADVLAKEDVDEIDLVTWSRDGLKSIVQPRNKDIQDIVKNEEIEFDASSRDQVAPVEVENFKELSEIEVPNEVNEVNEAKVPEQVAESGTDVQSLSHVTELGEDISFDPLDIKIPKKRKRVRKRNANPSDKRRYGYHASIYLPDEAQFAVREIAIMMKQPKPHNIYLEAMADLFEKYGKRRLAAQCRQQIKDSFPRR